MTEQVPSETFAIGEVAIMCNSVFYPENDGRECIVIGELAPRHGQHTNEVHLAYRVQRDDGMVFINRPHQLRKKRPPREDLKIVRWDECPWQPESIHG